MTFIIYIPQLKEKKPEVLTWVIKDLQGKLGLTSCPVNTSGEGFPILYFAVRNKMGNSFFFMSAPSIRSAFYNCFLQDRVRGALPSLSSLDSLSLLKSIPPQTPDTV